MKLRGNLVKPSFSLKSRRARVPIQAKNSGVEHGARAPGGSVGVALKDVCKEEDDAAQESLYRG